MIKCELNPSEEATVKVTYGLYEANNHTTLNLSLNSAKELWDKCSVLVNLGMMHWINKPLEE